MNVGERSGSTVVVLAAGLGRRFGGLKQAAAVGPHGEAIVDYSLYDACRAGMSRAVCVVRPEIERDFVATVGRRLEKWMEIRVVLQRRDDGVPERMAASRTKPWGTAHAVWAARGAVTEPFGVINADDLYGPRSLQMLATLLQGLSPERADYGMVAFRLEQTLSEWGGVARGVCEVTAAGFLAGIHEVTGIEQRNGRVVGRDAQGRELVLDPGAPVSMNLWAFTPRIFAQLEELLARFIRRGPGADDEFYISESLNELIRGGRAAVKVVQSPERWCGITHPGDAEAVRRHIREQIRRGVYPESLYGSGESAAR